MPHLSSVREFYAETYDICVSDWPGEIEFYRAIVDEEVKTEDGAVLELACGTGRVAICLAQNGIFVVGLDKSPEMLMVAKRKSAQNKYVSWVEGDIRDFQLDRRFDLVIIPGYSLWSAS